MLEQVKHYNDLSPDLRQSLLNELAKLGSRVTYVFDIAKPDPHPDNKGKVVYPSVFVLPQVRYTISDKKETREKVSPLKTIALIKSLDEKGVPNGWRKIAVTKEEGGKLTIDLTTQEGQDSFAYLELHPKHKGGKYQDKNSAPIFRRIDHLKEATERNVGRKIRAEAMRAAVIFSQQEVRDFACAMGWDEAENLEILRDKLETEAELRPVEFTKLVEGAHYTYRVNIKRAVDRGIIVHVPNENKYIWGSTQTVLYVLDRIEAGQDEMSQLAEYLISGGGKGEEIYKKIIALLK